VFCLYVCLWIVEGWIGKRGCYICIHVYGLGKMGVLFVHMSMILGVGCVILYMFMSMVSRSSTG